MCVSQHPLDWSLELLGMTVWQPRLYREWRGDKSSESWISLTTATVCRDFIDTFLIGSLYPPEKLGLGIQLVPYETGSISLRWSLITASVEISDRHSSHIELASLSFGTLLFLLAIATGSPGNHNCCRMLLIFLVFFQGEQNFLKLDRLMLLLSFFFFFSNDKPFEVRVGVEFHRRYSVFHADRQFRGEVPHPIGGNGAA